jgi:hypothetical protein
VITSLRSVLTKGSTTVTNPSFAVSLQNIFFSSGFPRCCAASAGGSA